MPSETSRGRRTSARTAPEPPPIPAATASAAMPTVRNRIGSFSCSLRPITHTVLCLHPVVDGLRLRRDGIPIEDHTASLVGRIGHPLRKVRVLQNPHNAPGERFRVTRVGHRSRDIMLYDL